MADNNEQRQAIISASKGPFSRFGLEKTTMEDIAKAAKKAKSTIYYYFSSKEEIFAGVIRHEMAGLKSAIIQAVEAEADPYYKLRKFVRTRLDYLHEKEDEYTTIKEEYLKAYEFIEKTTGEYAKWEIETIKSILEYGREKGLFEITDSEAVSRAIFFALKGLEYPWAVDLSREAIERSVEVLLDILLRGVSRRFE